MVITSVENEKIKNLCKLEKKKYRDMTNTYLVEGEHLVIEALKANVLDEIFVLEGSNFSFDVKTTEVSFEVMKKLSSMDTPINIIGLCHKNSNNEILGNRIVLLDELQDPGNLGTIIRSSLAFNIDTIILSENTVDLYNPKVLRATQGMHFHINIISMPSYDAVTKLKENNYLVLGTNVENGYDVRDIDKLDKFCLVMGNEGNGVRKEIQDMCDKNLYIKTNSKVESLNVGVACSILLYELGR
ncbi:MAG: RNA methyltransferase [Bacilli bacterium]|nr:RNA methyltransferase [Bacilli bacterium]